MVPFRERFNAERVCLYFSRPDVRVFLFQCELVGTFFVHYLSLLQSPFVIRPSVFSLQKAAPKTPPTKYYLIFTSISASNLSLPNLFALTVLRN